MCMRMLQEHQHRKRGTNKSMQRLVPANLSEMDATLAVSFSRNDSQSTSQSNQEVEWDICKRSSD
jgi:hypothetical protein